MDDARALVVAADRDGVRPRLDFLAVVRDRLSLTASIDELLDEYRALTLAGFPPVKPDVARELTDLRDAGWRVAIIPTASRASTRRPSSASGSLT